MLKLIARKVMSMTLLHVGESSWSSEIILIKLTFFNEIYLVVSNNSRTFASSNKKQYNYEDR